MQMFNGVLLDYVTRCVIKLNHTDRSSQWRQRLILEAWHSVRDRNAINEHIALPNIYNNIKNF